MSETNEHILSFRGKASIEKPLILGNDYRVLSTVTCRRVSTSPNDDGTVDTTYTVEPITSEITDELGKVVEAKKKSKMSVAMRFQIISQMRELFPEEDDDDTLYNKGMGWLLNSLPQILNWLQRKNEDNNS